MKSDDEAHAYWLRKLGCLNVANTSGRGVAPHKPLMIFCVMDLIEAGILTGREVVYDVDLVMQFRGYWDHVVERRRNQPDILMPFHALGGERDSVWERFDEFGNPSRSKQTTRIGRLDARLFTCFQSADFRRRVRRLMVATYFTPLEQAGLYARFRIPEPDTVERDGFARDREAFRASRKKGRALGFRAEVGAGYRYTCALTGRYLEFAGGSIVQACHIHQHAKSGNDDPRNGLALTPDAHWAFDKGLWTAEPLGDEIVVRVAKGLFREDPLQANSLEGRDGVPLVFHPEARLRPGPEFLAWHFHSVYLKNGERPGLR